MFALVLLIIVVIVTYAYFFVPIRKYKSQPNIVGQFWPPVLGVAKEFGIDAVKLMRESREQHGDVYTLNIAGKLFTVLHNPADFDLFFINYKARQNALQPEKKDDVINFDRAVQEFTSRVFNLPVPEFMANHHVLITAIRTNLAPSSHLPQYTEHMESRMQEYLDQHWGDQGRTDDLFDKIMETLFWSSSKALFGQEIFKDPSTYQSYRDLDANFEMAASGVFPEFMLGKYAQAKKHLLDLLKNGVYKENQTHPSSDISIFDQLVQSLLRRPEQSSPTVHHNFGLAILWASQANSLPATFWTIMNILTTPGIEEKVREEVDGVHTVYDKEKTLEENINQFPYIKKCVQESIRLQSPGIIIRKVMRPMRLKSKDMIIPEGHTLVISQFCVHRDEKNYQDPHVYDPERWSGKTDPNLFVAFGKGPHECPGRAFSVVEMILFLAIFFKKFKTLTLSDDFVWPEADLKRMIGIAYPTRTVSITYSTQ